MDAQRKSIQSLTGRLDEKREELSVLYRQFGAKLLHDSADEGRNASALEADRVETWRAFMKTRESDTQAVLDIKAGLARLSELNQFKKELETSKGELSLSFEQRLEALGKAFREMNLPDAEALFGSAWASSADMASALSELEGRQRAAREELEAAGFFGKMKAQFRLAGLESDLRQKREKLSKILREGARLLLSREDFASRVDAGEFTAEFAKAYHAARDAGAHVNDLAGRAESLESDIQLVKTGLEECGALENPQRRMDELRNRIRDTDRRIDSHASLCAREYIDKFYDEEGATRLGTKIESSESGGMGTYAQQLEHAAALRSEIASIRTKIEILETGIKIEALERNIAQWRHTVKDYEQRIRKYRELIETTERDISDAEGERERLGAVRDELERSAGSSADRE